MKEITCFKAYDVRGRVPDQLNEDIARRIGRAFAEVVKPRQVVVGHDIRLTSEAIKAALAAGLLEQGVDVYDIGLCGTEEIYFATSHAGMDGGIAVTASHNPKDYNGMKFVREESRPISGDTGLFDIKALAEQDEFEPGSQAGQLHPLDTVRGLCRAPAQSMWMWLPQAAENCGRCGQRWRRPGDRPAGAAPALRIYQAASRARRQLSQRRAQSAAGRKSRGGHRRGARARRRPGHRLGRRF